MNMFDISSFDVEELDVLNRSVDGLPLSTATRLDVVKRLDFVLAISKDPDVISLYTGLKDKLVAMPDDSWLCLRGLLPLPVSFSSEDVPHGEEGDSEDGFIPVDPKSEYSGAVSPFVAPNKVLL